MSFSRRRAHFQFLGPKTVQITNALRQRKFDLTEDIDVDLKTLSPFDFKYNQHNAQEHPFIARLVLYDDGRHVDHYKAEVWAIVNKCDENYEEWGESSLYENNAALFEGTIWEKD